MNWDDLKGKWTQMTGKIKEEWGELTDDEIVKIAGEKDQLVGKVQEKYGLSKEAAETQVENWSNRLSIDFD